MAMGKRRHHQQTWVWVATHGIAGGTAGSRVRTAIVFCNSTPRLYTRVFGVKIGSQKKVE
jgi:hypothetical protein